ncbi:CrcB protein [Cryobacterium mesophilum]|nr:CrcB family protein [Terrimesophilobacter mesophilus]MBB5632954.1 CrcB protein [Terrimesophilobacter mesophilus]
MNSDIEVARTIVGVPIAVRIRPGYLGMALLGGAFGTLVRFGLTLVAPTWATLNTGTMLVNLLGPFLLGALLQSLSVGTETSRRRALRIVVGVGFLGALTSYAELALDIVNVAERGEVVLAVTYGVATIALGALATWLGIFAAARWQRHAERHPEVPE